MKKLYFCVVNCVWYKGDELESESNVFAFESRKQRKHFMTRESQKGLSVSVCERVASGFTLVKYERGQTFEKFFPF